MVAIVHILVAEQFFPIILLSLREDEGALAVLFSPLFLILFK